MGLLTGLRAGEQGTWDIFERQTPGEGPREALGVIPTDLPSPHTTGGPQPQGSVGNSRERLTWVSPHWAGRTMHPKGLGPLSLLSPDRLLSLVSKACNGWGWCKSH